MSGVMSSGMELFIIFSSFVFPLIQLVVVAVVAYFVVKKAVRIALREHDEERSAS